MAGTLRAEATLAAANLVYLVLLGVGGVIFPLSKFPAGAQPLLRLAPARGAGRGRGLLPAEKVPAGPPAAAAAAAVRGAVRRPALGPAACGRAARTRPGR